jgi:AraC-like DNA-binding protein/quercetin dioxygenase-like cupin family protein
MVRPLKKRKFLPDTEPYNAITPHTTKIVEADRETRIELPFSLVFESLAYIGVVLRETWHVRPHYHEHFELCYVSEGQGWFAIEEFSYKVKQGDLFLTKPGEVHQGAAAGDLPFRLSYLGFQLDKMSTLELSYYQLGSHRVVPDSEGIIKGILEAIFNELQSEQKHRQEMAQGLFLQLLVHLLRTYEHSTLVQDGAPGVFSPLLRQVLYHVHTEIGNGHGIDELALSVHVSRSHLTHEFKRAMGVSLGQYLRALCLDWAKLYLRETSDTVSSIAERLRFSSIHTFSIFFKRHVGMSPQEYRRQTMSSISQMFKEKA